MISSDKHNSAQEKMLEKPGYTPLGMHSQISSYVITAKVAIQCVQALSVLGNGQ